MDQVSQVQFFPRDICTPLSKENAYLYYIAGGSDREPFQMFARRASFEKVSESDIVEQVKNKIKATSSISSLAKVWKMLDDVRETYNLIMDFGKQRSIIINLLRGGGREDGIYSTNAEHA